MSDTPSSRATGATATACRKLLSPRELELLIRIGAGESCGEIAEALHLSVKTVSTYRSRLYNKLGLRHQAAVMAYAREHDLIA